MAKILPRREEGGRTWREKRRGRRLALSSVLSHAKMPGLASREEGTSFLPTAQRSLSPFASPPSLSLKTKLPLSARIKLESP